MEMAYTTQKMKFSIKDFFSKCDQIRSFLRIWSHLLKKFLMENFIFCAVLKKNQSYYLRYDVVSTLTRRHVSTGRDESNEVVAKSFYGPNISQMK